MKWCFAAVLTASLLLVSCSAAPYRCTDPLGCLEISPVNPVVIGAILPIYGSQGATGLMDLEALKAAVAKTGSILGHDIELSWEGTDCSGADARLAATRLALASNLLAVIGPGCANDASTAAPIFTDAGLPFVIPASSTTQAFEQLVHALRQTVVQQTDGTLILPRTAFSQALLPQP
jgi:ABC-type branched-subunit amino acid transport system substrate-binding protein